MGAGTWRHCALGPVCWRPNQSRPPIHLTGLFPPFSSLQGEPRYDIRGRALLVRCCTFLEYYLPERAGHSTRKWVCTGFACDVPLPSRVTMAREAGRDASISVRHFISAPVLLLLVCLLLSMAQTLSNLSRGYISSVSWADFCAQLMLRVKAVDLARDENTTPHHQKITKVLLSVGSIFFCFPISTLASIDDMAGSDVNSATPVVLVGDEEKGLNRTTTAVTMSPEMFERVCFGFRPFWYLDILVAVGYSTRTH